MDALIVIGILVGIFVVISITVAIPSLYDRAKKYDALQPEYDELKGTIEVRAEDIKQLAKEKTQGFPWLATAYADYFQLQDMKEADRLKRKSHPAPKAAQQVKETASKRRTAERLFRILRYKLEYYENLFPWLIDFTDENIDDMIRQVIEQRDAAGEKPSELDDTAKKYLTAAEYSKLPRAKKYQLALERYWRKKKTKWEIGRDYERYIGYLYEDKGYSVYYQGIVEGFADLGRDLICVKGNTAEVVQCKYWSKEKQIHEKHIFQLYGTYIAYKIDHPRQDVMACFVTSTELSDRARMFAGELDIIFFDNYPLQQYPCVKCNISRRDGTKIYHLPFDQQYDRTHIEDERNECFVKTVKEAEDLGFRRAFRWRGKEAE